MNTLLNASLWVAALGSGVMAGIYFAFSAFVMQALGELPQRAGVSAMQSINEVIVSSLFLPLFMGTTLLSLGLAVSALFRWDQPGASVLLAAGSLYVVGMFVCTVAFNVPLNDALAAVDPASADAAAVWSDYLQRWTRFNHLRTVGSAGASALFVVAALARS